MTPFASPLIYVVDDDSDEHLLLRIVFAKQLSDFRLKYISHGSELLTRLTHRLDGQLPDLILLDLHMPILNGLEVLQVLKNDADWQDIPVAMRTTYARTADIKRCYELGSETVLSKNHSYQQLTHWVRNTLENCTN
ncbi:response regulator [Spirosoma sp. KNUC1025]|uniref:response regulator n=1 Tax=Spirosoma sp. KNUC1025 TaxID=2894082 RepID=UPI0038672EBF|nr:response regulator [Spirosoma sp. KNUC1025]